MGKSAGGLVCLWYVGRQADREATDSRTGVKADSVMISTFHGRPTL
jgi:hypothetical protein